MHTGAVGSPKMKSSPDRDIIVSDPDILSGKESENQETPHKPEDTTPATSDASSETSHATKGTRKHKAHHKEKRWPARKPQPKEDDFISNGLQRHDVNSGRGGGSTNHPGNKVYWEYHILVLRKVYFECVDDQSKDRVAQYLLDNFHEETGGRFIDRKDGRLYELSPKAAKTKIKKAIRDCHVPKYAVSYHEALHAECEKGEDYICSLERYRLREILINEFGMKKNLTRKPSDDELKDMVINAIRKRKVG